MKLKKGLIQDYQKKLAEDEKQAELREHYHIKDQNAHVTVKKKSVIEFLLITLAQIIGVLLIAVGIIALVFPEPREGLLSIWIDLIYQVTNFLGLE